MPHYVYITTNLINGKQYIGDHSPKRISDKYYGSGILILSAINKYNIINFKRENLEEFNTKEEAFNAQEKYIKEYNTLTPNGYNISPKGGIGVKEWICHSEETKEKMSKSHKGKKHLNETKEKISKSKRGQKHTDETKKRISLSHEGKKQTIEVIEKRIKKIKGTHQRKRTEKELEARKNTKKIKCEHCNKEFYPWNYARYHGNKCKNINKIIKQDDNENK